MARINSNSSVSILKIKEFFGLNENPDGDTHIKTGELSEMRGRVLRGGFLFSRPRIPGIPEMQNRFLPGAHLQMLVPGDAEIPHFGQLAGLDAGVSVRVFVQAQKLLDLQNTDRVVAIDMCQP